MSSKNDERSSPDWRLGANVIETRGAPSHLRMQELTIDGRMVRHLKDLYSRRDGAVFYSPPWVSMESLWSPQVLVESSWSPHRVFMESL